MRWVTHKVAAIGAAFVLHLPLAGIAASLLGGVLPDILDQKASGLSKNRQLTFNRIHRGFSHWAGLWLGVTFAGFFIPNSLAVVRAIVLGIGIGGLSHCVLDMLTPQGVPLNPFSRKNRFSLKLCKTGSIGEYCFCASMIAAMWFFLHEEIYAQLTSAAKLF